MIAPLILVLALPAAAASVETAVRVPTPDVSSVGMVNLSLIDALTAVDEPRLTGIFAFIPEKNSTFAFADLLARDKKALKRYLAKLRADQKSAGGLTGWDHEVCATLVTLYSSPLSGSLDKPNDKRMSRINECVLSTTVALAEIVARRKK